MDTTEYGLFTRSLTIKTKQKKINRQTEKNTSQENCFTSSLEKEKKRNFEYETRILNRIPHGIQLYATLSKDIQRTGRLTFFF